MTQALGFHVFESQRQENGFVSSAAEVESEMRIYGMKRSGTKIAFDVAVCKGQLSTSVISKIAFDVAVSRGQLSTSVISAHSGIYDGVLSNQSELFER